jgi:hypothetical protein
MLPSCAICLRWWSFRSQLWRTLRQLQRVFVVVASIEKNHMTCLPDLCQFEFVLSSLEWIA